MDTEQFTNQDVEDISSMDSSSNSRKSEIEPPVENLNQVVFINENDKKRMASTLYADSVKSLNKDARRSSMMPN